MPPVVFLCSPPSLQLGTYTFKHLVTILHKLILCSSVGNVPVIFSDNSLLTNTSCVLTWSELQQLQCPLAQVSGITKLLAAKFLV